MFAKINQKIYIRLLLTATLLMMIMLTTSVVMVSNMLTQNYVEMANQKIERTVQSCKNYLNFASLTASTLANNGIIISELSEPLNKPLTSLLDNSSNYAMLTDGITVYSAEGRIYSTSGMSGIPTLDTLKEDENLRLFFATDIAVTAGVRKSNIPLMYNNVRYNQQNGIIYTAQKVMLEGEVIGYIFVDIIPYNLYEYFNWDDKYLSDSLPMLTHGSVSLPYKTNEVYLDDFMNERLDSHRSYDGLYLIIHSEERLVGCKVSVAVPLVPLNTAIAVLAGIVTLMGISSIVIVHFIADGIAKNVDGRLSSLYTRMKRVGFSVRAS